MTGQPPSVLHTRRGPHRGASDNPDAIKWLLVAAALALVAGTLEGVAAAANESIVWFYLSLLLFSFTVVPFVVSVWLAWHRASHAGAAVFSVFGTVVAALGLLVTLPFASALITAGMLLGTMIAGTVATSHLLRPRMQATGPSRAGGQGLTVSELERNTPVFTDGAPDAPHRTTSADRHAVAWLVAAVVLALVAGVLCAAATVVATSTGGAGEILLPILLMSPVALPIALAAALIGFRSAYRGAMACSLFGVIVAALGVPIALVTAVGLGSANGYWWPTEYRAAAPWINGAAGALFLTVIVGVVAIGHIRKAWKG